MFYGSGPLLRWGEGGRRAAADKAGAANLTAALVAGAELRLPVLNGRALGFADNLGAAGHLARPLRCSLHGRRCAISLPTFIPDLASQVHAGDVLVAGQNLGGGGDGAASAARALAAAGVVAVVAGELADGFAEALLAVGLAPLEVDAPAVLPHQGAHAGSASRRARSPISRAAIVGRSRNLTEEFLERLRALLAR
jgi:hypothetical protein